MAGREDDEAVAGAASPEAADQKVDDTVPGPGAAAAKVDECSDDDEADPVTRNLNLMSKRNLMPPEWIENRRKLHYEEIELYNRTYDALENDDLESDDEAATAEYEEWSKRLWASVDFSGVNTVGGESCGMDAEAVYPEGLNPEEEQGHDAAAAESSSRRHH